jgi:hypothetical protein
MPIRIVAYYERWSGALVRQLQLNRYSREVTPVIADKPRTQRPQHLRPYLFNEFKRQPRLGWIQPSDQDTRAKAPAFPWVPIRQWVRWRPQPALGWFTASDQDAAPAPTWIIRRQWSRWQIQPQHGWAISTDLPVVIQVEEGPTWRPPVTWMPQWRRQPGLGWKAAGDVAPVAPVGAVSMTSVPLRRARRLGYR